jgi:methylthioribose-1-phosphate isomerase
MLSLIRLRLLCPQVRGAPLIAIVAMLGLAVELATQSANADDTTTITSTTAADASKFILDKLEYLRTSRPTAVNLFNACDEMSKLGNQTICCHDYYSHIGQTVNSA